MAGEGSPQGGERRLRGGLKEEVFEIMRKRPLVGTLHRKRGKRKSLCQPEGSTFLCGWPGLKAA